jgi:hypothetical protein
VPQFQFAVWRTTGGGYAAYNGSYPTSPFIATGVYGGTSISLFVNGVTYPSNTNVASNISTTAPIRVGKRWDTDQYFDGYIAEIILSASNLGTSDRQILELSQSTYYSISVIASTTITSQPSAAPQLNCIGNAATPLSVVASGTSITYQWYKNNIASNSGGTPISGATNSTYVPQNSTTGSVFYYVVVSGAAGTITSNPSGVVTTAVRPAAPVITGNAKGCKCF